MAIDFDYNRVFAERQAQEERLRAAGLVAEGAGVDMLTGRWDLFVYPEGDANVTVLSSVEEVDEYITRFGTVKG